jgi:hypothetical protein
MNFFNANLSPNEKHWDSVPLAGPEARGTLVAPAKPKEMGISGNGRKTWKQRKVSIETLWV